jgi:hypothetical protein
LRPSATGLLGAIQSRWSGRSCGAWNLYAAPEATESERFDFVVRAFGNYGLSLNAFLRALYRGLPEWHEQPEGQHALVLLANDLDFETTPAGKARVKSAPLAIEDSPIPGDVEVREVDEAPPPRLAAVRDGRVVGYVRSGHHDDVSRLLAIGLPLSISLTEERTMRILVDHPTVRPVWFGDATP